MATGATLVEDALLNAAILGAGEVVSAEDQKLALRILNRMLDSWSTENLMVYSTTNESFVMTPNQATYSTALLSSRPVSIHSMYVSLNNIDYEVDMIDQQTYDAIPYKPTPAIPNKCFYNSSYPDGEFYFYPTPYAAFTCTVVQRKRLSDGFTADTVLSMPPGYEKAIIDGLSVELCRPFTRKEALPQLILAAETSKKNLRRLNYEPMVMEGVLDKDNDVSNSFLYRGF